MLCEEPLRDVAAAASTALSGSGVRLPMLLGRMVIEHCPHYYEHTYMTDISR